MKTNRWRIGLAAGLLGLAGCGTSFFPRPAGQNVPGDVGNVSLSVRTRGLGTVHPGGGEYPVGTSITLKATAATGWRFLRFEDGAASYSPLATITLDESKTVTAVFVSE